MSRQSAIDKCRNTLFGLEKSFQPVEQDNAYYSALEIKSRKLQNRIAGILKSAEFTGHKELVNAIRYFQTKDIMESTAPVGFLSDQEQEYLRDDKGNFRIFLYKAVLFLKVAEALKSGSLSLPYSYKYCELNDYLISEKQWHAKRNVYIKQACLEDLVDIEKSLSISGNELKASYEKVNQLISQEKTPYITCRTDGSFIIRTPKLEEKETYSISNILPHKKDVPIQDVLSVISEQTRFSDQFIHDTLSMQYQRREDKALFAALIAYGCSVGIPRMARITRGQGQSILENIARQYMHIDNIKRANDSVLKKLDEIADYFNASNLRHTSNDGQKITLMAAHSTPVFRTNITAQEKELAVTSSWMIVSPISMRLSYRLQNGRPVMYWMG